MTVTVSPSVTPRRTLTVCGGAHALHDGITDLLNVLYPLLQSQFGLSYAAVGALKTVYSGGMAVGQIPSGKLAVRFGGVRVLAIGTALIAVGYGLAGLTGSLYGVVAGLLLAGLGGSTQHPIGSSLVSAAFTGLRSRTALGTYNFTGDVGKVLLPAVGLMLNGTSSVLYGTVPEFVSPEKRTQAFAIFYTGGSVAGATGPLISGFVGDAVGLPIALSIVACIALTTVPMVWALRPAFR